MFETTDLSMRLRIKGNEVRTKVWKTLDPEPEWQLIYFDPSPIVTGGGASMGPSFGVGFLAPANPQTYIYEFDIAPPVTIKTQLQRKDALDVDWSTIMLTDSPYVYSFNDYEARPGISTSYRIRFLTEYDFPGPWSSTVTTTIPTPGVSGGCLTGGHVMIFTTNERQSGKSNLAYSNAWENLVTEDFNFPEAAFTQLQPMYNKNFFTAFRPTERGGDQFQRDLLVQAAAISPETLSDFKSLRDMAWDGVSYICVRDEQGNRWFANIGVQTGNVQNNRQLYRAHIQITEVTDTPSQVDPDA
jgi:hypothetical protein